MYRIQAMFYAVLLTTLPILVPGTANAAQDTCPVITNATGSKIEYEAKSCSVRDSSNRGSWASPIKHDTGEHAQPSRKGRKTNSKLRYLAEYSTHCQALQSGKNQCVDFDEPPCPNGDPLITRSIILATGPTKGQTIAKSSYCSLEPKLALPPPKDGPPEQIMIERKPIAVTPAEFRSFPIKASIPKTQPTGFSLKNGHAHIYANSVTQSFNTEIQDRPVSIRAIPHSYLWNYGDGHSRKLQKPGKPMPNHTFDQSTDTSHVYEETGDFTIQLNTAYRGEYSVDGGPWMPIPGTASVPSDPMPMSVWRTKKLLVDQDCANNPGGPVCDSPFLREKSAAK